ncbi:MAG: energy-coupling factor transporter transmembrane protein EcfT [Oscillospiraceae bacterium]|nr:energy-coupling factor transporter transmembrane protein EcfT [Oscillospiraceae bacterium]
MSVLPTGLYQPGQSVLHRLCPWVKVLCLLLLLVAVVTTSTIWGYVLLAVLCACLIVLSKLQLQDVFSSAWRLRWFFALIFLMNVCFFSPDDPWVEWWIFTPSYAGLLQAVHVVLRVFLLLVMSNLLTATTAPLAMTDAFHVLLSPLKLLRLPVGQIAMILSVAMQFIPTLFEEADAIQKAQTARGARFDSRKLTEKAAAVLPLAVPIFLAAFKRADELSLAMEARGYRAGSGMGGRSQHLAWRDGAAFVLCAALCAVQLFIL